MAKFDTELITRITLFNDGCNSSNYRLKGLRDIDPAVSDNIMPRLREKHKHLTDAQHHERILVAMHEICHLVAAIALGEWHGIRGYIRVKGRSSTHTQNRGVAGSVNCSGSGFNDAIVNYAGYCGSIIIEEWRAELVASDDIKNAKKVIKSMLLSRAGNIAGDEVEALNQRYLNEAMGLVLRHWPVIEKAAVAMLLSCNAKGDITGKKYQQLVEYIRDGLKHQKARYEYINSCAFQPEQEFYEAMGNFGISNVYYMPESSSANA
jgi:hypothetical protein